MSYDYFDIYGDVPPPPPPKAQPTKHTPAAEEFDYIARRMKELADEREKRVTGT